MQKFLRILGAASLTLSLMVMFATAVHADEAVSDKVAKPPKPKADKPPVLAIGEPAPAWKELAGVDDKQHSLADLEDAKAVVVVFTCNQCPVAKAYEDRLIAIQNDYADKDVALVAINVNKAESELLPAMKERAEEKGFEFAYLHDPSQQIARDYGATVTPHVFILDGDRNLAYVGALDDNMKADKVEKQYLRDALDAILAGSTPETAETKPAGCGIKYEKK